MFLITSRLYFSDKRTDQVDDDSLIFVHGLGSDQLKAWTTTLTDLPAQHLDDGPSSKPKEINWVRDFLHQDLKKDFSQSVRIFLYGYDSRWMRDAPVVDLQSLAEGLITTITAERANGWNQRRIIFIAHSHGGLVVKNALANDNELGTPTGIASLTDGILFFGTPHDGSVLGRLAYLTARFFSLWGAEERILQSLVLQSDANRRLHKSFTRVLGKRLGARPIYCWNIYEEYKTTIFSLFGFRKNGLVSRHSSFGPSID